MSAAEEYTRLFYSVSDDPTSAVRACWSQGLDGAFEAVELIRFAPDRDLKALVVIVLTDLTDAHTLPRKTDKLIEV